MDADADAGLFGPGSITWKVHAEPVLWVGGVRALYLQALHPLAMAGVAQFSSFRDDPWGRLRRTADYVGVLTYGTTAEAHTAVAHVNRAHRGLRGIEPESGQSFEVSDPDLLVWVHCCQVDSFLSATRRAGLPLRPGEADAYVAEQVRAAQLVGVPTAMIPASTADLRRYFDRVRPQLRSTAAAREAAQFILFPPMGLAVQVLTPARVAWTGVATLAYASLPRWARRMYGRSGLPASPVVDVGATMSVRALAGMTRFVPRRLREGPHLRLARERVGV
ncbi:MAG TPA: oxygenase MpaB family protein [Jiangellaceae bacterium]